MRLCRLAAALACGLAVSAQAQSVTFTDAGAGLEGVSFGAAVWGDFDGDGDLDLALSGFTGGSSLVTRVYRNTGGAFADVGAGLPGLYESSLAWGDFDGDGDLDLALSGFTGSARITRVYRNAGGVFADTGAGLPGVSGGSLAWGDFDGDGDLDLALSGDTGAGLITRVYRNTLGVFTDAAAGLPGVTASALAWGDYNGDGDLDLALSGNTGSALITRVYRNTAGAFADAAAGLPGTSSGDLAWGDVDNDGDLDLALSGFAGGSSQITRVYRNTSGTFADAGTGLPGVRNSALAWGDYDRDGDLDLALSGNTGSALITRDLPEHGRRAFADAAAGLTGANVGSVAWGDYDGDGDLDLVLSGDNGSGSGLGQIARVYRSAGAPPNARPATPTGLTATVTGDDVTLSWAAATDDVTPAAALSYNVSVEAGGRFPVPAMALTAETAGGPLDGRRLLPAPGNVGRRRSTTIRGLPRGVTYRWSVQAVDGGFAGSAFATARSFDTGTPRPTLTLAGAPGWRMLAAPSDGITYDSILRNLWTQGFPGSDAPTAPAASCNAFTFDETVRTDRDGDGRVTLHDGWTCLVSQTAAWPVGTGLMVYVYADDNADGTVTGAEAFPKTIALSGTVARAPFGPFALSFTDDPNVLHSQEGWNLVGNPLSFGLDWDEVVRSFVDATLTFYDPAARGRDGGDYLAHTAGESGDLPGGIVPPGQGFFVKVEGPGPAMSVPYTAAAPSDPPLYGRPAEATTTIGETPGTPGEPDGPAQATGGATAADYGPAVLTVALDAVRPNPLRGAATVAFALPAAGPLRLTLVDVLGRAVAVLAEGEWPAGRHAVVLDAGALPPGVYVVRLEAAGVSLARRATVAR